jgi:hypothetical protein
MFGRIALELKLHAPFTAFGALTGIAIMVAILYAELPTSTVERLFWTAHPLHVLLSAVATTAMYRKRGSESIASSVAIGYVGSIGIATLSDSVIPFLGEWILGLENRGIHVGFIEKWWLVNPLAFLGIAIGYVRPATQLPHAGHVLLSTWASLFHMTLAIGGHLTPAGTVLVILFLFLAVWVPCCTSDIVFPLLFVEGGRGRELSGWEVIVRNR